MVWIRHAFQNTAGLRRRRAPRRLGVARMAFALVAGCILTISDAAAETAYSALRAVGAARGEKILTQVIEVRGEGAQEPVVWNITLTDSQARIREFEVRKGRITKESTPKKTRRANGAMDLTLVNLDSEGVLAVVNQTMEGGLDRERLHYTLSNGLETGTPVWAVKVPHPGEGRITLMEIAANTGEVIAKSVQPLAEDPRFLSDRELSRAIDSADPALANGRAEGEFNDREDPEKPARKKPASARSQEKVRDVPDLVESLVRRIEQRGRLLKRFLP